MASILYSAEIRWFLRDVSDGDPVRWLRNGQPPEFHSGWEPARVDRYLLFPHCDSIGVKERESKFEIKALRGAPESVRYPGGVSGRVDCWAKWSYGGEAALEWIRALRREPDGWVEVEKERMIRTFSLASGVPEDAGAGAQLEQGCHVEITRVRMSTARYSEWWSIGLEAFGHPMDVRNDLHQAATHLFHASEPPWLLTTMNSASYPTWLNAVFPD